MEKIANPFPLHPPIPPRYIGAHTHTHLPKPGAAGQSQVSLKSHIQEGYTDFLQNIQPLENLYRLYWLKEI